MTTQYNAPTGQADQQVCVALGHQGTPDPLGAVAPPAPVLLTVGEVTVSLHPDAAASLSYALQRMAAMSREGWCAHD